MSISTTAEGREAGGGIAERLATALGHACAAYIARRMEECAIAVLLSMSDRELNDIGLSRSELPSFVHRWTRENAFTWIGRGVP